MTPRLKVILVRIAIIASFWITLWVVVQLFPQERFAFFLAFFISIPVMMWIYMAGIKTKQEAKEFDNMHWKIFNWGNRFVGTWFVIGGSIGMILLLSGHDKVSTLGEKIAAFLLTFFVFLAGVGTWFAKDYQPKKIGDDYDDNNKNEKPIEAKQDNPLSGIYKKEDEK